MTEDNLEHYVDVINAHKPAILRGYADSLYELSRYIEQKERTHLPLPSLSGTAETLRPEMREKIENVFGTKVYNFYGSREVSSIAGECERGRMHAFTFWNDTEILDASDEQVGIHEQGQARDNQSIQLLYALADGTKSATSPC